MNKTDKKGLILGYCGIAVLTILSLWLPFKYWEYIIYAFFVFLLVFAFKLVLEIK